MTKHSFLKVSTSVSKLVLVTILSAGLVFPPQFKWDISSFAFAAEGSASNGPDEVEVGAAISRIIDGASENERAAKFREDIDALHEILIGTRVGIHPLDPFGALSQRSLITARKVGCFRLFGKI